MYKILIDGAFTVHENTPFKKIELHKKFNTQWRSIYNRDLVEFTKQEILEICPKDITDISMPKRDIENRLMGLSIIKQEFKKDILDPHIIIGGENI